MIINDILNTISDIVNSILDITNSINDIINCIPRTKYVRGMLWFSRRYAASASTSASADTLSFSR